MNNYFNELMNLENFTKNSDNKHDSVVDVLNPNSDKITLESIDICRKIIDDQPPEANDILLKTAWILMDLAMGKPLTPLSPDDGTTDEWFDGFASNDILNIERHPVRVNKRYEALIKDGNVYIDNTRFYYKDTNANTPDIIRSLIEAYINRQVFPIEFNYMPSKYRVYLTSFKNSHDDYIIAVKAIQNTLLVNDCIKPELYFHWVANDKSISVIKRDLFQKYLGEYCRESSIKE